MDRDFKELRREMVRTQLRGRGIGDALVLESMGAVPRECFVPEDMRNRAYDDGPLPIGEGQTISQPYMVAVMTEFLGLRGGERVLEIGTGSGYQAAVLARIVETVDTVERYPGLAARAETVFRELGIMNVTVHLGDGSLGWPEAAPYDRIMVTAAAPSVPSPLVEQLAPGGRLIVPVGERWGQILKILDKQDDGTLQLRESTPCVFVPLVGAEGWFEE